MSLSFACATVLRVPQEYSTIQTALDSVGETDTVLVALGVYHESLVAPGFAFHLIGDVEIDTGYFARPTIDPAPLPGSDSLLCMRLPDGCAITCEKMTFRMGPQGYPRRAPWPMLSGVCDSSLETVTFRYCLFDSLCGAIQPCSFADVEGPFSVRVEHCWFIDPTFMQLGLRGGVHASDCVFMGNGAASFGLPMAGCGSNSIYERCQFLGKDFVHLFTCSGADNRVRNCVFGPSRGTLGEVASFSSRDENYYEHNLFVENEVLQGVAEINYRSGEPLLFDNNTFRGNYLRLGGCLNELRVWSSDSIASYAAVIENNVFESRDGGDCSGSGIGKALIIADPVVVQGNRMLGLMPMNQPAVYADTFAVGTLILGNLFLGNGFAVNSPIAEVDARWNYWGDPSGPYNEVENPNGLGDEVRGNVLFDPWYPDSSFLDTPLRTRASIASAALRAFPNPFNANVTLYFEIPEPGIFRVELFDVLGRRVQELWTGPVAYEETIRFDGSALASGVYYARAWQTTHSRPVATTKLVLLK